MNHILRIFNLISLNVVFATGVCAAAFFKLPNGEPITEWLSLLQIMLTCWMIYILDRLLDVTRSPLPPDTLRHQFHYKNQYYLQLILIALLAINLFLLFFQPYIILEYGATLIAIVVLYLTIIVPRFPFLKPLLMPFIYTAAVVGIPFVLSPIITLSSWIVGIMFFLLVLQNLLGFDYFEQDCKVEKKRKIVITLGAINLFIYLLLFWGNLAFVNQLALLFALISLAYSFILSKESIFSNHYRWVMDSLLFLPILIF